MRNYKIKNKQVELHNIVYAITEDTGWEASRLMILEDMPDTGWNEYVLVEGGHCSCYGFDDTEWTCTVLTIEELSKILDKNDWDKLRKKAKEDFDKYI